MAKKTKRVKLSGVIPLKKATIEEKRMAAYLTIPRVEFIEVESFADGGWSLRLRTVDVGPPTPFGVLEISEVW